jgi:hypothetical protein
MQHVARVSAQHPGQFEGPGWLMAYGGGASPTGALGQTADVVSPPVALGAGETFHDIADVATTGARTLIVRRDGTAWTLGGSAAAPQQIFGLVDLYKVAAGGTTSFAIDTAGDLWVWSDSAPTPVMSAFTGASAVDANDHVAVAAHWDGSLWTWNHTTNSPAVRIVTPADFHAVDVAVGQSIAAARSFHGDVVIWDPASPAWMQAITDNVTAIAAGGNHVILARNDGTVLTSGSNDHGQLGNGTLDPSAALVVVPGLTNIVDVAAGASHSVAVASDGHVFSWGSNSHRQLLLPSHTTDVTSPVSIMDVPRTARYVIARGDTSILLSNPGTLAITHNIETYPFELECGQPFDATLTIAGFNASGGAVNNIGPGLTNVVMTLNVTEQFEGSGPVTVDAGNVVISGTQLTWTLPSLGASTASLRMRLYPIGPEGEFPVFQPFTYVSAENPAPFHARHPIAFHRECAAGADQTPPVISIVTPSPASLSPANRQMVPVSLLVEATDNLSTPVCAITGVSSNEPADDDGDWAIGGQLALSLRAERSPHGDGRVYRIAVACTDDAGNTAAASATVMVPKRKHH